MKWNNITVLEDILRRIDRTSFQEISKLSLNDVAGTYTESSGYDGHSLNLASDGRYEEEGWNDTGGKWTSHGKAYFEGAYLILDPGFNASRISPDVLLPVQWGERMYLLPDSEAAIKDFIDQVNTGMLRRGLAFWYLVRSGGDAAAPSGLPELPTQWAPYLLKSPVHASVSALEEKNIVLIDAGKDRGLFPGMKIFAITQDDKAFAVWRIESVNKESARCVPYGIMSLKVQIGIRVSTMMPNAERRE